MRQLNSRETPVDLSLQSSYYSNDPQRCHVNREKACNNNLKIQELIEP